MATTDKQKVRSGVDNPWQKPVGPGADDAEFLYSPVSFSAVINQAAGPLRRRVLLLWLAADDSRACTAQRWIVDGGWM